MFGSNNQDNDVSAPAVVSGSDNVSSDDSTKLTGYPPVSGDSSSSLPVEPTASPHDTALTAPHLEDNTATDSDGPTSLPPTQDPVASDDTSSTNDNGDLISIKQQALSQLSPIIDHLDQAPEDKFKTLMMMIQANDNQELIKEAYEAAQQITDEKTKSQALLDIVNEINYFTQKKQS